MDIVLAFLTVTALHYWVNILKNWYWAYLTKKALDNHFKQFRKEYDNRTKDDRDGN